jgi:hypothetical protein
MWRVTVKRRESITSQTGKSVSQRDGVVKQFLRHDWGDFSVAPGGSEAYYASVLTRGAPRVAGRRIWGSVGVVTVMEETE